ncbi:multiple epidermal growth factor-like domains protein 10 isoform X2 [Drosophila biarmipes]|uniref:multiple epidermal growth factor-like domains protein 10 isoform X2 n=1 Tax=Drosophila biarmipes TaxID=125945 RepID=UPI001CDA7BA7|nr:multiple epidermal growth factor-like domains protein 10 isoform X2 [Drosophila biarmipes]
MYSFSLLFVCLAATICLSLGLICSNQQRVTYMAKVPTFKSVPYQQYSYFKGWETKYRRETVWEDRVAYRYEPKYSCCAGYEGSIYDCKPVCKNKCPTNGFCASPDHCICKLGYAGPACEPVCTSGCGKNEICERPAVCSCQSGYHRDSTLGHCLPICPGGCGDHSFCSEPAKCECEPLYKTMGNATDCRPVCSPECGQNSFCQEPNLCTCLEGYKADERGICSPICQEECGPNSRCLKPGVCECEDGHVGDERGANCQPECSSCPENGSCLSPNVCTCNPGYVMKDNRCEPHCEEDCSDYGHCVAPNKCECYPGHEKSTVDMKCAPKCTNGCPNGFCFSPEKCVCNNGYLMGPNNTCEPQCSLNCVHGQCTHPEACTCDTGYRFKENSAHVCEAICESGCKNGDCMAPNICICHEGYEPSDINPSTSVCKPQCAEGCEFGECVAPHECKCWPGYEKVNGVCRPQETTSLPTDTTATDGSTPVDLTTTTETDLRAPTKVLQVHYSNCTGGCMCWIEYDEEGALNTAKCAKICVDPEDEPCLNLDNCHCALPTGQLVCKEGGSEDSSLEETHYLCKMQQLKKARPEAEVRVRESTGSVTKLMVILGSCAGIILGAAIAVMATKYYIRSTSRRIYVADEAICENDFE